jgi:predicted RNA-binding Zn ribbon-like protein
MHVTGASSADEELLLDLLNTTPVLEGVPRDDLEDPSAARGWMREHGITPSDAELEALIKARTTLQAVVRGQQSPDALQRHLASLALRPVATAEGLDWQIVLDGAPGGASRAVLAWDALRISSPGRLRPCANADCRLFLIDRSKPNTARWCSMATCGNRMKARRHYRRIRSADG